MLEWKDNICSILHQYMGVSTIKAVVNFIKDPITWNWYTKENYTRKASELKDEVSMIFSIYLTFKGVRDESSILTDYQSF